MDQHINLKISDIEGGKVHIQGDFTPEIKKGMELTKAQECAIDIYNFIMSRMADAKPYPGTKPRSGYGPDGKMTHDECEAKCPKCGSNCKVATMTGERRTEDGELSIKDADGNIIIRDVTIYCGNGSCSGWSTNWNIKKNEKTIGR